MRLANIRKTALKLASVLGLTYIGVYSTVDIGINSRNAA